MKKQSMALLGMALFAGAMLVLAVASAPPNPASAEDKTPPSNPKPDGKPVEPKKGSSASPASPLAAHASRSEENQSPLPLDPAFDRFVDLELLGQAIRDLDSAALADAALQLAEGERVLHRPHKSGITADHLLRKAATLAVKKRDKATLDRLSRAAEKQGDKELISYLGNGRKLAEASRAVDPALRVSVEEMKPETFALYKHLHNRIGRAELLEDAAEIKTAELRLSMAKELPAAQKEFLQRQITKVREGLPKKRSANSIALAKLSSPSRTFLSHQIWDTTFTDQDGNPVEAEAVLQGDSGSYFFQGNTGTLYNLIQDTPPNFPIGSGVPLSDRDLFGYWQLNGSSGWFYWGMTSQNTFLGNWGYGNFGSPKRGSWKGRRNNASGSPGGGGWNSNGSSGPINPFKGPVSPGGGWGGNGGWGGSVGP